MGLRKVAVVTPGSFVIPSGRSTLSSVVEQTIPLAQEPWMCAYLECLERTPSKDTINGVPCYRLPSGANYYPSLRGGSRNGDRILSKYTIARCWLSV